MILHYIPKSPCHCCFYQWRAGNFGIHIRQSGILTNQEKHFILYIPKSQCHFCIYKSRAKLLYIYRNSSALPVYIKGQWRPSLYYITKSPCHCCQCRAETYSILYTENRVQAEVFFVISMMCLFLK